MYGNQVKATKNLTRSVPEQRINNQEELSSQSSDYSDGLKGINEHAINNLPNLQASQWDTFDEQAIDDCCKGGED